MAGAGRQGTDATSSDALGHELRDKVPRASHAAWAAPPERPDPVGLILDQDRTRVQVLVGLRHERMAQSPFAFLRGAAVVMAHDLALTPSTGLEVQASGDAHLRNFGFYGSPERNLVFDVTDFDETLPAPWEWDLKRLAASFVVAGRVAGHSEAACAAMALACGRSYRGRMREMSSWAHLQVWYALVDAEAVEPALAPTRKQAERTIARTRAESGLRDLAKLTEKVDGRRRFVDTPPLVTHVAEGDSPETLDGMAVLHGRYRSSLAPERRVLLDRYRLVDAVRKVVGVGSVGTRCAVALLIGASPDDPLFLQVKEARASVLEAAAKPSPFDNHGERIVRGQRLCQAASDVFLGWVRGKDGRDYYVRQLRDMKRSVDSEALSSSQLAAYAEACGWVLARSHARSGDPAAIGGYLGSSDAFDQALASFAAAYADQTEFDHAAFVTAVGAGR